ncbi:enoyl-CoA hydratase-related protein [Sphingobium ummariense]
MIRSSSPLIQFSMVGDHIAVVTLNRPEARNAINAEVTMAMEALVDAIEADSAIRVVVLTGAGGQVFCAGADLKEVSAGRLSGLISPRSGFAGFVNAPRTKPWIAAVEGLALAGGCEIALACDMIVASQGGAFGLPEVTRGLAASAGGLYRLPRALPRAIAIELILTADRLPSERAAELGMVNHLVPAGTVLEQALIIARKIAGNAPLAVRESLAIARAAFDRDDQTLARLSDEAQDRLRLTEDFQEGPSAFVEKRAPRWAGR